MGEVLEIVARLAQAPPEAFHVADAEAPVDQVAQRKTRYDEVAACGSAVDTGPLERVGLDQREIAASLIGIVGVGTFTVVVAVAFESAAGDRDNGLYCERKFGLDRGDVDGLDDADDR